MNLHIRIQLKLGLITTVLLLGNLAAMAAGPKAPSSLSNPLAQALLVIMVLLALAIALLGNVVNSATDMFRERLRRQREEGGEGGKVLTTIGLVISGLLVGHQSTAQAAEGAATTAAQTINGLQPLTFYMMIGVIAIEILILAALAYQLKFLMGIEKVKVPKPAKEAVPDAKPKESWWWRLNAAVAKEREKDIDLQHDYDGIRELDNKIPPWWMAAFLFSILFGVIYLWRYHVAESAPLQIEEYQIAMKKAEDERAIYLKTAANNVDENTVAMLDAAGIAAGKAIYTQNCVACHGSVGEGNAVGPNLTDEYWIHGGSLGDIFKSVKYGWPEKGMQSWKELLSPIKIAQVTSYIKTLEGTKPPNAREPQGEKYVEEVEQAPIEDGIPDAVSKN